MKTAFIYALCEPGTRTVRYIGKANDPKIRMNQHWSMSATKSSHLGCWLHLLKSRGTKPELIVLREVPTERWQEYERRYIRVCFSLGIRITNGNDGGLGGNSPTPEARKNMSAAHVGKKQSPETIAKRVAKMTGALNPMFGKEVPLEVRAKISASLMGPLNFGFGKKQSPETIAKRVAKMSGDLHWAFGKKQSPELVEKRISKIRGKTHTEESKANMSAGMLGRVLTPEHCANIGKAQKGHVASEETRARMRASQTTRREREKAI